jgi:hypothetical protein
MTKPISELDLMAYVASKQRMPSEPKPADSNSSRNSSSASAADLNAVYEAALTRYFADRHAKVDAFVRRHFSLRGILRIHHRALGLNIFGKVRCTEIC